ncbi:MAG TPA: fibrobacter succinogenes major paralogous domain-containing protein [Chitinophagaceae bacterium]|nr:fibrobacter succinogenes major paralogous domain-containing protein [Chitinophagaceae bacterium]
MRNIIIVCSTIIFLVSCKKDEIIPPSVTICNQVWMLKNLDVSKYRNGENIQQARTDQEWVYAANNRMGTWCYYENNSGNGEKYGKLYNWYAVTDPRGLSPEGWHIPTDEEWTNLYECVGGSAVAGGELKETGTINWLPPNHGATNNSSFTALPGGLRAVITGSSTTFFHGNEFGVWWSATEESAALAWARGMYYNSTDAGRSTRQKLSGFSVRCVRD